ncbi:MAG: hypothetical protein ABW321_32640 [Polyangiales bacterium]
MITSRQRACLSEALPGSCLGMLLACTGSCDSQVSPAYTGESLLTVVGSVEIAQASETAGLVPAIAFVNSQSGRVHVVDVAVQGEFPTSFRLDVFDPPPQQAFIRASASSSLAAEPEVAIGYVTAVMANHPESFLFSTYLTVAPGPCGVNEHCLTELIHCTPGFAQCLKQTFDCPIAVAPPIGCTLLNQVGDPSLADGVWTHFAGLSENYLIAYLASDVAAESWTATWLGVPQGLPAGYHLLAFRQQTLPERSAALSCNHDALVLTVERHNQRHGTSFSPDEIAIWDACDECTLADASCSAHPTLGLCALPMPARQQLAQELAHESDAVKLELHCALNEIVISQVPEPDQEAIALRLGQQGRFLELTAQ